MKSIDHWIGGQIVAGTSGRTGPVYDPARGELADQRPRRRAARSAATLRTALSSATWLIRIRWATFGVWLPTQKFT